MDNLYIEVETLSESIFGNGQSATNIVDLDILHDDYGIPYFKGKTFKGKLREEVEEIVKIIRENTKKDLSNYVDDIFGKQGEGFESLTNFKFSNCTIKEKIKNCLIYGQEKKMFTKKDVLESLTEIRSFTSMDEKGMAKKGGLRQVRVIKKGLKFYVDIHCIRDIESMEKYLIAAGASSLRHLGLMESRGKGYVKCKLYENGKDVTELYLSSLEKEVNNIE
ncbi:RAMP superfamily CRISPR-associated protein [Hathewaya histolytica]|uniref:RAMP superfamily CRISPR-associated protein n=1 Tax=Hathewaya histolytica TaxID=1498 RepID=UPI003B6737EF